MAGRGGAVHAHRSAMEIPSLQSCWLGHQAPVCSIDDARRRSKAAAVSGRRRVTITSSPDDITDCCPNGMAAAGPDLSGICVGMMSSVR